MSGVWVEKSVLMTDEECAVEAIEAIGGRVLSSTPSSLSSRRWPAFHVEQATWSLHTFTAAATAAVFDGWNNSTLHEEAVSHAEASTDTEEAAE